MQIHLDQLSPNQCYGLMTQLIVPRPIAWVLSENSNQTYNLAPFSFFNGICSDPPLIMLSVGKKDSGEDKDTLANIKERDLFVVHQVNDSHLDDVNASSKSYDYGESEIDRLGLATSSIDNFPLPRLTDCDVALACRRYQIDTIGNTPQAVIFGEIVAAYINADLLVENENNRILFDAKKASVLSRLGGSQYSLVNSTLSAVRPK